MHPTSALSGYEWIGTEFHGLGRILREKKSLSPDDWRSKKYHWSSEDKITRNMLCFQLSMSVNVWSLWGRSSESEGQREESHVTPWEDGGHMRNGFCWPPFQMLSQVLPWLHTTTFLATDFIENGSQKVRFDLWPFPRLSTRHSLRA